LAETHLGGAPANQGSTASGQNTNRCKGAKSS